MDLLGLGGLGCFSRRTLLQLLLLLVLLFLNFHHFSGMFILLLQHYDVLQHPMILLLLGRRRARLNLCIKLLSEAIFEHKAEVAFQ